MPEPKSAMQEFEYFLSFGCTCDLHIKRREIYEDLYRELCNLVDTNEGLAERLAELILDANIKATEGNEK